MTEKLITVEKFAWSPSSVSTFYNCPYLAYRKHFCPKEDRLPFEETPALIKGNKVHEALENLVRVGAQLPYDVASIEHVSDWADEVKKLTDDSDSVKVELQAGLTKEFTSTGFFENDVWARAKIDLWASIGDKHIVYDYKTGKSTYTDEFQLKTYIAAVSASAQVPAENVYAGFLYVCEGVREPKIIKGSNNTQAEIMYKVAPIERAFNQGAFPKTKNNLCRFCPIEDCKFNKKR